MDLLISTSTAIPFSFFSFARNLDAASILAANSERAFLPVKKGRLMVLRGGKLESSRKGAKP